MIPDFLLCRIVFRSKLKSSVAQNLARTTFFRDVMVRRKIVPFRKKIFRAQDFGREGLDSLYVEKGGSG